MTATQAADGSTQVDIARSGEERIQFKVGDPEWGHAQAMAVEPDGNSIAFAFQKGQVMLYQLDSNFKIKNSARLST